MSIEEVFDKFKSQYPNLNLMLASGYPGDIGKLSDIDGALYAKYHRNLDYLFPGFAKDMTETAATVYSTTYLGREINIYATGDRNLVNRGVIHRRNEISLARKCPLLLSRVIEAKRQGMKTEPAWIQAIGITVDDPYEAMLEDLTDVALAKEAELMNF